MCRIASPVTLVLRRHAGFGPVAAVGKKRGGEPIGGVVVGWLGEALGCVFVRWSDLWEGIGVGSDG